MIAAKLGYHRDGVGESGHLRLLASAVLGLTACNFEVPSSSYLVETTMITVLVEVAELGPLNPERVAVPQPQPVTEIMPGDRLALEAFVVDHTGERLPASELDSLWFQCGAFSCGVSSTVDADNELFDVDCDALADEGLAWTMDAVCRLGGGDGRFEFLVPELGQLIIEQRVAQYYGVIAWGGRSADSCWTVRRSGVGDLEHCAFVERSIRVGPSWWMLAYADSLGLASPVPIPNIPLGAYIQQANRAPDPQFAVYVDNVLVGTWPADDQFAVDPGARVEIVPLYDETTQFLQSYFMFTPANFVFKATAEVLRERPYTTNAMVWIEPDNAAELYSFDFAVDEYAEPGTSRVLFYVFDDRYGESVRTLEFEVGG